MNETQVEQSATLMSAFARRTGITSDAAPTRYLWTDAFAVCNYSGLARVTGEDSYRQLAGRLVDQVHETLGRHREDDTRTGRLSGLDEETAQAHPTRGGLRIGKPLPERGPEEPFNERLEWERDGQYFHYLTKWMHALDVMARAGGEARFAVWARELAQVAAAAFVYQSPQGRPRMYWKMSIDLSRPLVPSMGHHDPLDGYITLQQLAATAVRLPGAAPDLRSDIQLFGRMIAGRDWGTTDPLGLGGLLMDAVRLAQLIRRGHSGDHRLLQNLLKSAVQGVRYWSQTGALNLPVEQRLAFRELGLAIGLRGAEKMFEPVPDDGLFGKGTEAQAQLEALDAFRPLGERIISFWLEADNQSGRTWTEHEDINSVMLATTLVPSGFLVLPDPDE